MSVQSRGSPGNRALRRARRYLLHYILLGIFCLAIAFVMCYTVFFKLDKIKISGCTVYSETQIVDEIGAQKGDSLFRINISNAQKKLVGKLPYIRSVKIKRQFPTTLRVEVQEEEVLGAVYTETGFAVISTTGKVLDTKVLALPEGTPRIVGMPGQMYETGSYLKTSTDKDATILPQIQSLAVVNEQLKLNGFEDITYYDVSDMLSIKVMYEDRLLLKLGTEMDMDYKLQFIRGVLDKKEEGDKEFENIPEEGTLDFSSPPALHAMAISVDRVKNEDAYVDFGVEEEGDSLSQPIPPGTESAIDNGTTIPPAPTQGENAAGGTATQTTPPVTEHPAQTTAQPQPQQQFSGVNEVNGVVQNTPGGVSGNSTNGAPNPTVNAAGQSGQQNGQTTQPQQNVQNSQNGQTTQNAPAVQQPTTAQGTQTDQNTGGGQNGMTDQGNNGVFNSPSRPPIVN